MPSHFLDGDGRLTPASDHLLSTWGRHCLDPQAPHNLLPQLPLGHPPPPLDMACPIPPWLQQRVSPPVTLSLAQTQPRSHAAPKSCLYPEGEGSSAR